MTKLLIKGGRVIDPASGFDQSADILIEDGVIAAIGRVPAAGGVSCIDAEGCVVSPGLIDVHVHFREPDPVHTETVRSGSAAAVGGGYAAVCCMPNTQPPIDSPQQVELVQRKGRDAAGCRVLVAGCATHRRLGERIAPIDRMAAAGAAAFSDDGDCVADAGVMEQALRAVRSAGRCFMQHCQDPALTRGAVMNAGPLAERLGLTGWSAEAEEVVIERDLRLNEPIGCRYHAQHLSSGGSVELIRRARAAGRPVSAEVSPHHLLLTEDLCDGHNTAAKMNPPLRRRADIEQLKAGVADGTIAILATDHAPHPAERKQVSFEEAAFGVVGLECALPLYLKALVDDRIVSLPGLLAMMTCNAAELLGINRMGLGALSVGGPADVTVIDTRLEWTIRSADFASTGRSCPFEGWNVRGRAIATIVGGDLKLMRAPERARV